MTKVTVSVQLFYLFVCFKKKKKRKKKDRISKRAVPFHWEVVGWEISETEFVTKENAGTRNCCSPVLKGPLVH